MKAKLFAWLTVLCCSFAPSLSLGEPVIRIGSKNFTEQWILGEILAQWIEADMGIEVKREFNLAGTRFVFEALRSGEIDLYAEYTGTGLVTLLNKPVVGDAQEVYQVVQKEFSKRFNFIWGEPFGFNNTYALAVRNDDKRFDDIGSISELSPLSNQWQLAASHEFIDRSDGYPGLAEVYGLNFSSVRALDPGIMYSAAREGEVDVIAAFSTDGRLEAFDLRLLEDDQSYFPPYYAAPLVRQDVLEKHPQLMMTLDKLSGQLSNEVMMGLNFRVDFHNEEPEVVARDFLQSIGFVDDKTVASEVTTQPHLAAYFWRHRSELWQLTKEHLFLVGIAMMWATIIGVSIGVILTRFERLTPYAFAVVNLCQTIPSLALLGFLIPLLGIGVLPAIVALFFYALLPIVSSTYSGIRQVDRNVREAAVGLGFTNNQILRKIEVPLAFPIILSGVRTSTVLVVGTATLAAFIGAGGFGNPIFRGISSVNTQQILFGAIPAALLAILIDRMLNQLERLLAWRETT